MRLLIAVLLIALSSPVMADWHHGGGGGHEWHGGGWHGDWHGNGGGGGLIGGFLGGLIGSVITAPPIETVPEIVPGTPPWYAYCMSKYRSFDTTTGTFLGLDGVRHPCQ